MTARTPVPFVVHVIHRLATGGLENGLVNLINRLPEHRYRHAVVCMADYDQFRDRIRRDDVAVYAMRKRAGHDPVTQIRLFGLLRKLRPDILHGRNLAAFDSLLPAALAGVKVRIHGEHGRDEHDPDGTNPKRIWLRRLHSPLVSHYVTVNTDLEAYLVERVGIRAERITRICNGVDLTRFRPADPDARALLPEHLRDPNLFIVGTVGRMEPVKDPCNLARAFARAVSTDAEAARRMRLVMVGDGALQSDVTRVLQDAGVSHLSWLPGNRGDVPQLLPAFDLFVLPSMAEGISNTILEAMASGLPLLATRVGGNAELIEEGATGRFVGAGDSDALAAEMLRYFHDPAMARRHGAAGRLRAEREFSLERMVASYDALYTKLLADRAPASTPARAV